MLPSVQSVKKKTQYLQLQQAFISKEGKKFGLPVLVLIPKPLKIDKSNGQVVHGSNS